MILVLISLAILSIDAVDPIVCRLLQLRIWFSKESLLQWAIFGCEVFPIGGDSLELLHEKSNSWLIFTVDLNHVVDIIWLRVQFHSIKTKHIAGLTFLLDVLW